MRFYSISFRIIAIVAVVVIRKQWSDSVLRLLVEWLGFRNEVFCSFLLVQRFCLDRKIAQRDSSGWPIAMGFNWKWSYFKTNFGSSFRWIVDNFDGAPSAVAQSKNEALCRQGILCKANELGSVGVECAAVKGKCTNESSKTIRYVLESRSMSVQACKHMKSFSQSPPHKDRVETCCQFAFHWLNASQSLLLKA